MQTIQQEEVVTCHRFPGWSAHLDVSVDDLIVMEIFEPFEDLFGVEDDGSFVVLQRAPFRAQERRQAAYKSRRESVNKQFILNNRITEA